MPEWLLSLLIGGVVMGLIGVIYRGVLTKSEHADICKMNSTAIRDDLKAFVREQFDGMKEYIDLKVENVILKEIKKLNGSKE